MRADDPLIAVSTALEHPIVAKRFRTGSHRSVPPSETVARLKPLMADLGITRVANVTGLDRIGIPVVMVCRPNARSIAVCQGKGADLQAAIASGLMEAAEIHHAEQITLPLRLGSLNEIVRDHTVVDIARLPRVADNRFHDNLVILWIEGFDLFSGRRAWLPFEMVRANYTLPLPPGSGCFDASTNGLASGNQLIGAISHGICEVIERDATALWNRLSRAEREGTRIDLESVDDPVCRELLRRLRVAGFEVAMWETTSDVGVPSFFCVITDSRGEKPHIGVGSGCHVAREIAFARALTEAVQVRTTYISGARDDLHPDEYEDPLITGRIGWARRLGNSGAVRSFRTGNAAGFETINEDVGWLLQCLRKVGIEEAVAVNLTKPQFGIPVVRMVIPGLEGPDDHDGYVPGERALRWGG